MKRAFLAASLAALMLAGGAAAYATATIYLNPGSCTKVGKTKVCARKVAPVTITVAPSPVGQTFTGSGDQTIAPFTLTHGAMLHWTAQPDSYGYNTFSVSSSPSDTRFASFDNGNNATAGQTYLGPGTYTLNVIASAAWTISF